MVTIGKLEFWVHKGDGHIWITERNPCGCHPDDYTVSTGPKASESGAWMNMKRSKFLRLLRERGFEKLQ